MKIRLLRKKDISTAAAIVRENYSKEYARRASLELKEVFGDASIKPKCFVAEEKGEVIGFITYTQSLMNYDVYEIFWVNVSPGAQKQGVGKKLVTKAIDDIKKKRNARLIILTAELERDLPRYYAKNFGFTTIQVFGETEYLMSLAIK